MTDRLTPRHCTEVLHGALCIFGCADRCEFSEFLGRAARREAEAKPRFEPCGYCLEPQDCPDLGCYMKGNGPLTGIEAGPDAVHPKPPGEGPGSAAAPKFMPSAIGPFGFRSKDTDVTEELCIHRVRRNIVDGGPEHEYDSIGLTVADIHAKDARIKRLEADKAALVAALEMFNGPITHATFERARMTLAKHGGA